MNTSYTGTPVNAYYTKRYSENLKQTAKVKDKKSSIKKYFLKISGILLVGLLIFAAYTSVSLVISINAQKAIYKQNLEYHKIVLERIETVKQEIETANTEGNITYRASKEIGMVKRNEASSTFIPVPEFEVIETVADTKAENYMEFNMMDAIISIFN